MKEALTVSQVFHRWICIYGVMDILQSDNGSKSKEYALLQLQTLVLMLLMNDHEPHVPKAWSINSTVL